MKCTSSLQSSDICDIIKACAKSGVLELSLDGFSVKFAPPPGPVEAKVAGPLHTYQNLPESALSLAEMGSDGEASVEFGFQDRQVLEDIRRTQLLIDDPSSWEQEQIDAIVENDRRVNGE